VFLPGVALPPELELSADPFSAAEGVDLVVSVVPTQFVRGVAQRFEDALDGNLPLVTATKGFEIETLRRPSQILSEVLGERTICALTGPSHAEEVARGLPASVVAASEDEGVAALVQASFGGETFRVYTSSDSAGAEIAGAIKNVIAVAAGIGDGLDLGDNAKAALVTRGVVEMARYGTMHGGRSETFFGLAGIGDLIATCCSKFSRNRAVGEAIGRGRTLQEILAESTSVAEGVWTTQALFGPESEVSVDMPIAEQVYEVLYEGKDPRAAVSALMQRAPVEEMRGLA
jgi:glycerol-3-phosphate dehydrogenase (NAD(P)+)